MGKRNRFVQPEIRRCDLADGEDWIEIKVELTAGEREALTGKLLSGLDVPADASEENVKKANRDLNLRMNWAEAKLGKVEMYLVDWSFVGADDKPVPLTRDAINALHPDDLDEVSDIIDKHNEEREALKKTSLPKVYAEQRS